MCRMCELLQAKSEARDVAVSALEEHGFDVALAAAFVVLGATLRAVIANPDAPEPRGHVAVILSRICHEYMPAAISAGVIAGNIRVTPVTSTEYVN